MEPKRGANNWIGVLIIILIIGGAFFFVSRSHLPSRENVPLVAVSKQLSDIPLFVNGLSAAGISANEIGFHSFSPDGKYFFFSAFKQGATPANQAYLVSLITGEVTQLPGIAERGFGDSRVLQLYQPKGITLYWPATGEEKSYDVGENAFFGSLSPNGKVYVVNTSEGIKKIDITTGLTVSFTKNRYDGAYAWFPDNTRMLGFKATDERLTDGAGTARALGVWNMETGDFIPISSSISAKTLRSIEWVVPGKIARINAGFDDGSFDYLLNIDTKEVIDLGDTSGSLMGGVKTDSTRGIFALVGGDDGATMGPRALLYKGMEQRYDRMLAKGYTREQMHIVDEDRLIYIRKEWGNTQVTSQQLVLLDFKSGEETVLYDVMPREYAALSLSSDKKTWLLSQDAQFITGSL